MKIDWKRKLTSRNMDNTAFRSLQSVSNGFDESGEIKT